jgi:hypothetical protein
MHSLEALPRCTLWRHSLDVYTAVYTVKLFTQFRHPPRGTPLGARIGGLRGARWGGGEERAPPPCASPGFLEAAGPG